MKILTEYKTKNEPATMKAQHVNGVTIKDFKPGEAVGIYLRDLKPNTINLIETLLASYTKEVVKQLKSGKYVTVKKHYGAHPLTLKYEGKQYKLYSMTDWKHTYQDPKDQLKTKTDRHPILESYLEQRKRHNEWVEKNSLKKQYKLILDNYDIPEDHEVDSFLQELAPLYEVDVDYTDNLSRYRAYVQLKYYLDHDFEYSRPANAAFIMPIGNETYLEDLIYKEQSI